MSQQDVYDYLKQNPNKKFSSKQLSKKMDYAIPSVTVALMRLRKHTHSYPKFRFEKKKSPTTWFFVYWYYPGARKPCRVLA